MATSKKTPAKNLEAGDPVAPAEVSRIVPPIAGTRFNIVEYQRNIWEALPLVGVQVEDMLDSKFWQHVAVQMKVRDRIEVFAEDGTYFAELIVLSAGRLWAKVALLRHVQLQGFGEREDSGELAGYKVEYAGVTHKYRVLDGTNVLKHGFDTEDQAREWLKQHINTVATGVERQQKKLSI